MTKLDAGLTTSLLSSDPASATVWGRKRINPRSQSCFCLTWSGCPSKQRRRRPTRGIVQRSILARPTAEVTCRFRMGCWCQNTTHSCLIFGLRRPLVAMCERVSSCVPLLRRVVGWGWGAGAKTLCTTALYLVYSTAECCAPVWCRSAHIRLIDSVFNDALHTVTEFLRPTPTDHLPILSGIQPAKLRRLEATFSLA